MTHLNFWELRVQRNRYGKQLQLMFDESLKAKMYTLQSSDPMHPSKTGNHSFLSLSGTVLTILLPTKMLSHSIWLCSNDVINELWQANISRESIKYSFLTSYGKFKKCFTCATYTDLSFLTTDEIPRVWLKNIQARYRNGSRIVNW